MADIDINAGLAVKANINELYADVAGSITKYREDRRFNKDAYQELLEKYAKTVIDIEKIRIQINEVLETEQSNRLPTSEEVQQLSALAGLLGAKKQDGTIDLKKLISMGEEIN